MLVCFRETTGTILYIENLLNEDISGGDTTKAMQLWKGSGDVKLTDCNKYFIMNVLNNM